MDNRKKIVYLLGAGAMIEFGGPKTDDLTAIVSKEVKSCSFDEIISSLDVLYGENGYNFETIIAVIEELLNYTIAIEVQGSASVDNTNVIRAIYDCKYKSIKSEDIWNCFSSLINAIISEISKYGTIDSSALDERSIHYDYKLALLYQYLFNKSSDNSLKFYSLNYDRLIPSLLTSRHFYDATNEEKFAKEMGSNFECNFMDFVNNKLTYFNLHGSIYLKQVPNQLYRVVQSETPCKLSYAHYQKGGSPNERIIFSPIITGYSKSQRIMSEPFNFGFSTFFADINTCDELVIIGYSFSDPHINSVISTYLRKNISSCTIVDFKKNGDISDITHKLDYELNYIDNFYLESDELYRSSNGFIRIYIGGFSNFLKHNL